MVLFGARIQSAYVHVTYFAGGRRVVEVTIENILTRSSSLTFLFVHWKIKNPLVYFYPTAKERVYVQQIYSFQ